MLRRYFACLIFLVMCLNCSARDLQLSQLHHKAWRASDGAPSDIAALAQTADGYLWLGTAAGLYRFDGVRFESVESAYKVKLSSGNVSALMAGPDGGLWIGYRFGGISYLRSGKIIHYPHNQKGEHTVAPGTVRAFAQQTDGTVWALSIFLNVFRNGKWQLADPDLPRDLGESGVLVDRLGGVWVGLGSGLYWKSAASPSFTKVSDRSGISFFSEAPDGTVWALTDRSGLSRFDPRNGRPLDGSGSAKYATLAGVPMFDRQGSLWIASQDYALVRLSRETLAREGQWGAGLELFTEKSGLTGGTVKGVLQDREGNVWVGTGSGLDQFRESRVAPVPIPAPEGTVALAMAAAEDGKVWVSDWRNGLYLAGDRAAPVDPALAGMMFMYRGAAGRVWMGSSDALWLLANGKKKRIDWPDEGLRIVPQAAVEDAEGGLWVSLKARGLFRLFNGVWEEKTSLLQPGSVTLNAMAEDGVGGFWASRSENSLVRISGGSMRAYGPQDGLDVGPIIAISADRGAVWLGGVDGAMGFDGRRFRQLQGRGGQRFRAASGVVVGNNGDLWLNTDDGIVRITTAELSKWRADKDYLPDFEKLNYLDGVVGKPQQTRPLPTALQASDGRLWFTTGKNVTAIDPAKVISNGLPPPVLITRVDVDGAQVPAGARAVLAPGARRIEIAFAGLSLSVPERNRYRYRLVDVDPDWVPADRSRLASYTNLAPGDYRFEVSASNNDGVWSVAPAQLRFEVLPAFYQTWWFRSALVLALVLALWLAHHLRMKVLTRRISDRLQSQQMERVRIARELHDTLLQGVGSLSLVMRSAINKVDREHPVVPFLSNGLKQAEFVIEEGRQRVAHLRVKVAAGEVLVDELGMLGLELTTGGKTRFDLNVQGEILPLETQVAEECRIIAREAIWNAVQHAGARTISLTVEFGRRALVLRVRDDGAGLPPEVAARGAREGHWGLSGMRERAGRIGGQLEIASLKGTTVELRVPARLAYRKQEPAAARRPLKTGS